MIRLARAVWLVLVVLTTSIFVAALPARYIQLRTVTPTAERTVGQMTPLDMTALAQLNLSADTYAFYFTTLEAAVVVSGFLVGILIFWRRGYDPLGLSVSFALFSFLALSLPTIAALFTVQPWAQVPVALLRALSLFSVGLFVLLFPDGRFVPRATRWLAVALLLFSIFGVFAPEFAPPMGLASMDSPTDLVGIGFFGACISLGILAQIYRYRFVSTPRQRQQTKWVEFGFVLSAGFWLLGGIIVIAPGLQAPGASNPLALIVGVPILLIGFSTPGISVAFAVLRSHLWDIDVIVRRTLTYTLVTAALAAVFFGSIIVLQRLFAALTGERQNELVTVISTLAIAALFVPVRNYIQRVIDKRFNRNKYNAQQVLERFAATVRDETDLDQLTGQLAQVVDETMQPKTVSVWVKAVGGRPHNA